MSQDKSILLKIKNLVIEGYSDEHWIEIVHGVDLTLHRGEVMGLIGESGAGKSGADHNPTIRPSVVTRCTYRLCRAISCRLIQPGT
jgi:ABC-type phosphonate transport system ATPase subunit